jgi:hypothetical protein
MRGDLHEAARAVQLLRKVNPRLTIGWVCEFYPLRRDEDRQRLIVGMRRAGVPE